MEKEKELLRKQMELLAEQSRDATDREIGDLSVAMCKVHSELVKDSLRLPITLFLVLGFDLAVRGVVQIEKLFRRDA